MTVAVYRGRGGVMAVFCTADAGGTNEYVVSILAVYDLGVNQRKAREGRHTGSKDMREVGILEEYCDQEEGNEREEEDK
ncbi:hypothetical protein NDU88_005599 [Pleurodeles waltl]|uniref:Uncharacterized protein n=1 Tax=Pleurodeles waltl TaxID=8319 RepID=A0AAV7UIH7_PLEWA|nr:hypothetical protein NDU88_005599 [Pleurodeles waltl]